MQQISNRFGLRFKATETASGQTRVSLNGTEKAVVVAMQLYDFLDQWSTWQSGALIQKAFPTLSASDREFFMTGLTDSEFNEATAEEDEPA